MAQLRPTSNLDRRRLINAWATGQNVRLASNVLGIKAKTAEHIIHVYDTTGRSDALPRGGRRQELCKIDDEMRHALAEIVDSNPFATLTRMRQRLHEQLPDKPMISINTIGRALRGMLYTLKIGSKEADIRMHANSEEVINKRREFAQFMTDLPPNATVIYVDETGYNLWTRRTQGRSPRGQAVLRQCTTQRGPNMSLCLAISSAVGLVKGTIFNGGQTRQRFQQFVTELVQTASQQIGDVPVVIVCDGPTFHRGIVVPEEHRGQFSIQLLPPYSPFLNPCEMAHSAVKAVIKQQLTEPSFLEEEAGGRPDGVSYAE